MRPSRSPASRVQHEWEVTTFGVRVVIFRADDGSENGL